MKIALVIEQMNCRTGGREVSTAQIASGLARRGHEVTIVCRKGYWPDDSVSIHQLGGKGLLRARRLANFITAASSAVMKGAYDIVHAMLPMPQVNVYQPRGGTIPGQIEASRRRWGLAGGLRKGVFERLNLCRRQLGHHEQSLAGDTGVMHLAVSKMVADEYSEHYGRQEGVKVIYNGVDVPDASADQWQHWRQKNRYELGVGQGDPAFITVASNFPLKGVDNAIRAFAKWVNGRGPDLNARLIVVGRDTPEAYQRTASLLGVGRIVLFVPPTEDIFQWYAAADACVLLSWYDPCSRTVLEAVRWGLPCITTAYNGACEVLSDGAGIVVASPKDEKAIIAAFQELSDPHRRKSRADACNAVSGELSMDRHVEQLIGAYEEAIRAK